MSESMDACMHASDEIGDARVAWMDSLGMVNDVFNLPDAAGNGELLVLANRGYLKASEDLMAAWNRMEE